MIQLQPLIANALKNKHTTGAAAVALFASGLEFLGPLWFPEKAHQFQETGKWLFRMAGIYGLTMAGDAKASVSKEEADTAFVKKEQLTTTGTSVTPKP